MKIKYLDWDNENIDHIANHKVIPEEIEEVFETKHLAEKGGQDFYYLSGQSRNGRFLFIVLKKKAEGFFRVITAREMTIREKHRYKRRLK